MELKQIKVMADNIKNNISQVIVGKDEVIDLLLVSLISSGHVLLEDVPGMGKTLLAKSMAKSLNCTYKRIQFTPDLLPSDLIGIDYYNQKESTFQFKKGPIFTNILLADEINRATPRTQSSLLECMEEKQVSADGNTMMLEPPFMVIATQNPVETGGTFPLPEAQLDRFLIKLSMGYPSKNEELSILTRFKEKSPLLALTSVIDSEEIVLAQENYSKVYVCEEILKYIVDIVDSTRNNPEVILGISPRGSQALLKAVQAYALINGRNYVIPDDIKALAKPVLCHRLILKGAYKNNPQSCELFVDNLLKKIPVPTEDIKFKG